MPLSEKNNLVQIRWWRIPDGCEPVSDVRVTRLSDQHAEVTCYMEQPVVDTVTMTVRWDPLTNDALQFPRLVIMAIRSAAAELRGRDRLTIDPATLNCYPGYRGTIVIPPSIDTTPLTSFWQRDDRTLDARTGPMGSSAWVMQSMPMDARTLSPNEFRAICAREIALFVKWARNEMSTEREIRERARLSARQRYIGTPFEVEPESAVPGFKWPPLPPVQPAAPAKPAAYRPVVLDEDALV